MPHASRFQEKLAAGNAVLRAKNAPPSIYILWQTFCLLDADLADAGGEFFRSFRDLDEDSGLSHRSVEWGVKFLRSVRLIKPRRYTRAEYERAWARGKHPATFYRITPPEK